MKSAKISLNNGGFALVSKDDLDLVSKYSWRRRDEPHTSYAYTVLHPSAIKQKYVLMHRLILGLTDHKIFVDHKNWNGLDNRRENIRPCTPLENQRNRKSKVLAPTKNDI